MLAEASTVALEAAIARSTASLRPGGGSTGGPVAPSELEEAARYWSRGSYSAGSPLSLRRSLIQMSMVGISGSCGTSRSWSSSDPTSLPAPRAAPSWLSKKGSSFSSLSSVRTVMAGGADPSDTSVRVSKTGSGSSSSLCCGSTRASGCCASRWAGRSSSRPPDKVERGVPRKEIMIESKTKNEKQNTQSERRAELENIQNVQNRKRI